MVYRGRHYSESESDSPSRSASRSRSRHRDSNNHHSRNHDHHSNSKGGRDDRTELSHRHDDSSRRYRSRSRSLNENRRRGSFGFGSDDGLDNEDFAVDISETVHHRERPSLLQTTKTPAIHSIQKGTIRKVLDFGSFVRIPEYAFDGLVHIDQYIPDNPPPREGDSVFVKVMKVYESDGKIKMSLSMKECNQNNGKDLNPSNQHNEGYFADDGGIHVGSIRKTVCTRCGMTGHMDWECYVDLKNKDLYTLVSDDDDKEEEQKKRRHRHKHRHHHHKK